MDENRHLEKKIPNLETIIFRFQPLNFRSVKCRLERCVALSAYRILPISLWRTWTTYFRGRCQLCSNQPKSCHQKDGTNDDHTGPMETTVRLTYDLQVIYASIVIPMFDTATLGSNLTGHTLLHTPWILCTTSICQSEILNVEAAVEKNASFFLYTQADRSKRTQVWNCSLLTLLKWYDLTATWRTATIKYSFGSVCVCVFIWSSNCHTGFAMAEAKSVLATPGALQNAPWIRFLLLLQAEEIFLKMTNQEQLMMFKNGTFLTLIPTRFLRFYQILRITPRFTDVAPATGAPHLDVEVQLPEHRIQVSGLRELSFESKMCWKLLANGEQGPPRK